MVRHTKYFRAFNGVEAFDEPKIKNPGDYVGRHRLEQVWMLTSDLEKKVMFNVARKGFQRCGGAELIT